MTISSDLRCPSSRDTSSGRSESPQNTRCFPQSHRSPARPVMDFSRQQTICGPRSPCGCSGQRLYRKAFVVRLQQTTSVKHGAHTAHTSERIDDEGLFVAASESHGVPKNAHLQNRFWTPVGLRRRRSWLRGYGKCLKRFGGPGEIRTHDLFHAMEARSQLRHRPADVQLIQYLLVYRSVWKGSSGGDAGIVR